MLRLRTSSILQPGAGPAKASAAQLSAKSASDGPRALAEAASTAVEFSQQAAAPRGGVDGGVQAASRAVGSSLRAVVHSGADEAASQAVGSSQQAAATGDGGAGADASAAGSQVPSAAVKS